MAATFYVVATPIGNLEDITLRALRILRDEASVIACEDTRQTKKLLDHFDIHKPLVSYHEHNEASRTKELLERLGRGESVALVSDAGTPLISDPGYRVVEAAVKAGFPVVPIPGASALLTALSVSGLPTDTFRFIGFVPPKSGARRRWLESLKNETATVIAYESPHRIIEMLTDMHQILGARPLVLARELTKIHEEFLRGTPADVLRSLETRPVVKGEITLVIGGASMASVSPEGDPIGEAKQLIASGADRMDAIKETARRFGLSKRDLYRRLEES